MEWSLIPKYTMFYHLSINRHTDMLGMLGGKEAVSKAQGKGPKNTKNHCDGSWRCFYVCGRLLLRLHVRMRDGAPRGVWWIYLCTSALTNPSCLMRQKDNSIYMMILERYMLVPWLRERSSLVIWAVSIYNSSTRTLGYPYMFMFNVYCPLPVLSISITSLIQIGVGRTFTR